MCKKISIITVTLNCSKIIEKTIESVLKNLTNELEYIVIDGDSKDGTKDIIKNYEQHLTYWHSKKDSGIYQAMNEGLKKATGKYVYFINAGDILINLPIDLIFDSEEELIAFPVKLNNDQIFKPELSNKIKYTNTLHHQGSFYKKSTLPKYNTEYKVFSDFNTNQILYKKNLSIKIYDNPIIAYHDIGGVSHNKSSFSEIYKIIYTNFGFYFVFKSWIYFKFKGLQKHLK